MPIISSAPPDSEEFQSDQKHLLPSRGPMVQLSVCVRVGFSILLLTAARRQDGWERRQVDQNNRCLRA